MDDRRTFARQLSCIPASFESKGDAQDLALIRDVSVRGAKLLTRIKLELEEPVTLHLYLGSESEPPRQAVGKVRRVERREPALSDMWGWEVGIEFDATIDTYQKEIDALTQRQEQAGVLRR
jgi:hypothetical protein